AGRRDRELRGVRDAARDPGAGRPQHLPAQWRRRRHRRDRRSARASRLRDARALIEHRRETSTCDSRTGWRSSPAGGGGGGRPTYPRRFLAEGAKVMIADIGEEQGRNAARDLAGDGDVEFVRTDIADPASAQGAVDATVERFGTVDILVNNAAIYG